MDVFYKLNRIRRWSRVIGLWQALRFEIMWSLKYSNVQVQVPGHRYSVHIRRNSSDLSVFEMIFIEKELEHDLPTKPSVIIDGGANVGYSSAFYSSRYPDAIIIAVEPSDNNIAALSKNCSVLHNVVILKGGLVLPQPKLDNAAGWVNITLTGGMIHERKQDPAAF